MHSADPYMRIVMLFDRDETAGSFLREDGDGGFTGAVERMAREIDRLRAAMGAEIQKRKAAEAELTRLRNGITELSLTLPVVGTLFVARGGATARAVRGVEVGPDEHSDLVRATDVTNALVQSVALLIGATPISATGGQSDG